MKLPKNGQIPKLSLAGFSDIFTCTADAGVNGGTWRDKETERIVEIPTEELHPPEIHPFQVNDDAEMDRLVSNVQKHGIREPGLARPRAGRDGNPDGYELLCGNRRRRACQLAGIPTMPVIVRELDDDTAAITMVDSNLEQREKLLPSEKASAYRIKLEALNHRGSKSETPGQLSVEILCGQTGESKNQIYRLVRLTELIAPLIEKVDARWLAFNPAVELSYLSQTEQAAVASAMEAHDVKPSLSQAKRLKTMKQSDGLTMDQIDAVLSEIKKPPPDERDKQDTAENTMPFRKFFPSGYSLKQMNDVISELLEKWWAERAQEGSGCPAT